MGHAPHFKSFSQKYQCLAQIAETQCAKRAFKRPSRGLRDEVQGLLELLELCLCVSAVPEPNTKRDNTDR